MLHDAAEVEIRAVVEGVNVDLNCVVEEMVDSTGWAGRPSVARPMYADRVDLVVDDLHAAAAEHVGRLDEHWIADLVGDALRLGKRTSESVFGGRQIRLGQDAAEGAPLLGEVDRLRAGADNRNACILERLSESEGVCPPSCTMTPAIGPAACSACTTSSTSSSVSGSKYSRSAVS